MNPKILVWASLLAGDFGRLEAASLKAQEAGADGLHVDIMDGHFVPNLSMGPDVVKMAKRRLNIPLIVHLMMTKPELHIRSFAEAGADSLSIHVESRCDIPKTLNLIRGLGVSAGLALNPETPAKCVIPFLPETDSVLCMTVHPGFGGQSFMPGVLPQIAEIRRQSRGVRDDLTISVDGGIDLNNAAAAAEAGANAFVAGSFLYQSPDMARDIARMREKAESVFHG